MKNVIKFGTMMLLLIVGMTMFATDVDVNEASKIKAVELIEKAINHITEIGSEQAFKDFSNKEGVFVDGSYYIFVVDFEGLTLAHGGNPGLVGMSMFELQDADGKLFIQEFIKVAKEKGSDWVDYKWSNPTTKKVESKSTYVQRIADTDYFLGCGIYLID
jgi:cytochrome c